MGRLLSAQAVYRPPAAAASETGVLIHAAFVVPGNPEIECAHNGRRIYTVAAESARARVLRHERGLHRLRRDVR